MTKFNRTIAWSNGAEWRHIGSGVWAWEYAWIKTQADDFESLVAVELAEDGRYEIRSLIYHSAIPTKPSYIAADVSIAAELEDYARVLCTKRPIEAPSMDIRLELPDQKLARKGPVTETLEAVALVWTMYNAVGDQPTKRVAEHFLLAPRTASRWVSKAREEGVLTAFGDH